MLRAPFRTLTQVSGVTRLSARIAPRVTVGFRPALMAPLGMRLNSTATPAEAATAATGSVIQTEIAPVGDSLAEAAEKVAAVVSPDQIGYFESVGLAQSWIWPPGLFQHIFEYANHSLGLPWWATIAVVTISMRALLFPLYLKSSNATAKMTQIKPEINRLMKEYNLSDDPIAAQRTLIERRKLMMAHDVRTSHMMLPLVSIPFFIGVFSGLNGMASVPIHDFATQGVLWFQNLAVPDPYLGLQVITASFYALTFKLGGETGANNMSPAMKKVFTWMPFIAVPMTMSLPAGTCMYFALNGILSVGQTALLQNKSFRNMMGLAPIVKAPLGPEDNVSLVETMKKTFDKAKERAEKAQREADREARLKKEKAAQEASRYVQFTKKKN